jgi:hypothetical protein
MIVAGIGIVAAAYFLLRRDFDTAFVIAVAGAVAWFLNYRAQMKEITTTADAAAEQNENENEQG